MKKFMKVTSYMIFVACLLISNFFVPMVVSAKTVGDLKSELAQFKDDYENNRLEANLNEEEKKKIQKNVNNLYSEISRTTEEIDNLNREITTLQEEIVKDEQQIDDILSFTQIQNGESAYLEYAFGAKDFTDFIYRIAISEQLTSYNNELIETNKQNIEKNKKSTEELATKKAQLADKQVALKVELSKIEVTLNNLEDESLKIKDKIQAKQDEIDMYVKGGCKDSEDINTCLRNVLPSDTTFWRPLQVGYLTGWFGMRWHPIWNENRMHYGMDLSSNGANAGGQKVYSVANGVVASVFTYYDSCGGKKIYIKHNVNGVIYTSGYWHLNNVFVQKGQVVTKDTLIGTSAGYPDPVYGKSDTCSNGAHLHLELSTGDFGSGTYESNRISASNYINFPSGLYKSWSDRTTRLK